MGKITTQKKNNLLRKEKFKLYIPLKCTRFDGLSNSHFYSRHYFHRNRQASFLYLKTYPYLLYNERRKNSIQFGIVAVWFESQQQIYHRIRHLSNTYARSKYSKTSS